MPIDREAAIGPAQEIVHRNCRPEVSGNTIRGIAEMRLTAIAGQRTDLAAADPDNNLAAEPVQDDRAHFPPAELAPGDLAGAELESQLDLQVERELARGPAVVELRPGQPLAHPAERALLVPVAVRPVRGQPLDRAAAERIALVVTAHPAAEAVALSAAAAQTSLGPVAAEAVIAWVAAVSAVAVAEEAAVVVVVAVAVVAVVEAEDAGDEQFTDETKIYEIEIKHYELIKNFTPCVCNRCGGVFIAGRAGG